MNVEPQSTRWPELPQGSLGRYAAAARGRERRQSLARAAGIVAACVIVGAALFLFPGLGGDGEPSFGGVTCTIARANAAPFMAGSLEPDLSNRIRVHLESCPAGQEFVRGMNRQAAQGVGSLKWAAACECSACRAAGAAGPLAGQAWSRRDRPAQRAFLGVPSGTAIAALWAHAKPPSLVTDPDRSTWR